MMGGYDQNPVSSYGFPPNPITSTSLSSTKRAYDRGFDTSHMNSSLTNGARPHVVGVDIPVLETDDGEVMNDDELAAMKVLEYRRADGTKSHKKIESPL